MILNSITCALIVCLAATLILGVIAVCTNDSSSYAYATSISTIFCGIISGVLCIVSFILFIITLTKPDVPFNCSEVTVSNNGHYPVKVAYISYNTFTRPSLETIILMPGNVKLLYDAKVTETIELKMPKE